jgi:hypothetical protein
MFDLEEAKEYVGESGGLQMDGFDDCIIGIAERCSQQPLLVYSRDKIVEQLMKDDLSYEEAQEYIDFNMAGAWMGEGTPLIMTGIEG